MEVHKNLGAGYLERVYHQALEMELNLAGIPFESEFELPIHYKGAVLPATYRADLICHGDILLELKAQRTVGAVEQAQVINYLKAGHIPIGLLLNFGEGLLNVKRFVGPEQFHRSSIP